MKALIKQEKNVAFECLNRMVEYCISDKCCAAKLGEEE
jgi:hypothetical protein